MLARLEAMQNAVKRFQEPVRSREQANGQASSKTTPQNGVSHPRESIPNSAEKADECTEASSDEKGGGVKENGNDEFDG